MDYSPYVLSNRKRAFDIVLAFFLLILTSPLIVMISLVILIVEGWPIFFVQDRVGKGSKNFRLLKFRTMYVGAEFDQRNYLSLNEAHGPVFKIKNDPRFVGIGKWLSRTGLDELPQLINVLRGEMSLVGPRPLPTYEHTRITQSYSWRTKIKPGIFSSWITKGAHALSFSDWMKLDKQYMEDASLNLDIKIIISTVMQAVGLFEAKLLMIYSYSALLLIAYVVYTYN